jgi:hypothetical protein
MVFGLAPLYSGSPQYTQRRCRRVGSRSLAGFVQLMNEDTSGEAPMATKKTVAQGATHTVALAIPRAGIQVSTLEKQATTSPGHPSKFSLPVSSCSLAASWGYDHHERPAPAREEEAQCLVMIGATDGASVVCGYTRRSAPGSYHRASPPPYHGNRTLSDNAQKTSVNAKCSADAQRVVEKTRRPSARALAQGKGDDFSLRSLPIRAPFQLGSLPLRRTAKRAD